MKSFQMIAKVPGTTNVYRSWHPYKVKYHKDAKYKNVLPSAGSSGKYIRKTEPKREEMVQSLYEKYGIKTDICLSEDETANLLTYALETAGEWTSSDTYTETIPAYYQTLLDAGNVLHMTFTNAEGKEETMQYKYIYQADHNEKYLNDALQCISVF